MPQKTGAAKQSYAELNRQLDEIVAKLQDPEVAVDDATRYYEQALEFIRQLERHLDKAENRILEIKTKLQRKV